MSLRLEMLQVARLAPKLLLDSSSLVEDFILSNLHQDGGFTNRAGEPDLYYTVFGLESLLALQSQHPLSDFPPFLKQFETGDHLDFVHLACLARAWADIGTASLVADKRTGILDRIETFRTQDGGYNQTPGAATATTYACFLALGAYQDLETALPHSEKMIDSLSSLQCEDGGFANQSQQTTGLTPPTAAAITLLRHFQRPVPDQITQWLLQRCLPQGGFSASPKITMPDLLSTATALHALAGQQVDLDKIREVCLDFIDSVWVNQGSFYGNWTEETLDTEYTYYGLLALGHLAV